MYRLPQSPRHQWQKTVEALGFHFHKSDNELYWDESAAYQFTAAEIDELEHATLTLENLCLEAVSYIIDKKLYHQLSIPEIAIDLIEISWRNSHKSLYGRFDLAYDGIHAPKLLEYNADTPTAILESSVIQWQWLQEVLPKADQFNSIHERLIAVFEQFTKLKLPICFASSNDEEDLGTLHYLQDTALQAGLNAWSIGIDQIGWQEGQFVDEKNRPIPLLFKLYPWEWMVKDEFFEHIIHSKTQFIEPPWKMLLSNKGILPILWQLFPHHQNLVFASFSPHEIEGSMVKKPLFSREGANIQLSLENIEQWTDGPYGQEGYVYQQAVKLPCFDGNYPVIGSWVIGHKPSGIGIREDINPITSNKSRFIPHYFID